MQNYTPAQRAELEVQARKAVREGARRYKSRIRESALFDVVNAVHNSPYTFRKTIKGMRVSNPSEGFVHTFKSKKAFLSWLARSA